MVRGVSFEVILGMDFLTENDIAVSPGRHALVFEGQGGMVMPLMGLNPRIMKGCCVAEATVLGPRESRLVRVQMAMLATQTQEGSAPEPTITTIMGSRVGPLRVPAQLILEWAEVVNAGEAPLHLPKGHLISVSALRAK